MAWKGCWLAGWPGRCHCRSALLQAVTRVPGLTSAGARAAAGGGVGEAGVRHGACTAWLAGRVACPPATACYKSALGPCSPSFKQPLPLLAAHRLTPLSTPPHPPPCAAALWQRGDLWDLPGPGRPADAGRGQGGGVHMGGGQAGGGGQPGCHVRGRWLRGMQLHMPELCEQGSVRRSCGPGAMSSMV